MFVGLDGCAKGWVAVRLDNNGTREIDFLTDLKDCLSGSFTRAMIDIPIGLPDSQYRNCDLKGRKLLRRKSIPPVQRRPSSAAFIRKARRRSCLGKGHRRHRGLVSAFLSVAKDRQVDELMTSDRQTNVRESHPELIFQRLNDGASLPSKKTHDGIRLRRRILLDKGFASIDAWLDRRTGTGAKPDDVLDACACAVAAREAAKSGGFPGSGNRQMPRA